MLGYKGTNTAASNTTNNNLFGTLAGDQTATDNYLSQLNSLIGSNAGATTDAVSGYNNLIRQNNSVLGDVADDIQGYKSQTNQALTSTTRALNSLYGKANSDTA